jgi:hypothetical protein
VTAAEVLAEARRLGGESRARGGQLAGPGPRRITSLDGIIRGRPPRCFDGNAQTFSGLYFHLEVEGFAFYSPLKRRDDPLWINVTELMRQGVGPTLTRLMARPELAPSLSPYVHRRAAIDAIKDIDLHIEEVTGEDKTTIPGGVAGEDEERLIQEVHAWVAGHGLPEGEFMHELADPETGEPLAVLGLAWPAGLQEGLSQPVALLIDEGRETEEAANRAGDRYFTDAADFWAYVQREVLSAEPASV